MHRCMTRCKQYIQAQSTQFNNVARTQAMSLIGDFSQRIFMCPDRRTGGRLYGRIAVYMIMMLMGIHDQFNIQPVLRSQLYHAFSIQRIKSDGLTGFFTGDQIIKISERVIHKAAQHNHIFSPAQTLPIDVVFFVVLSVQIFNKMTGK